MFEFKLPDLGEGIHEGEILQWHTKVGESIKQDDPLVDVETDKAAVTIPSPKGGKIHSLSAKVGDTVTVGQTIAVIAAEEAGAEEKEEKAPAGEAPAAVETPAARPEIEAPPAEVALPREREAAGPVPAAPATRRLARELGVDINQVPPTGPAGRVTPEDVKRFAAGGAAPATRRLAHELGVDITQVHATGPGGRVTFEDVKRHAGGEAAAEEAGVSDRQAVAEFAAHAASAIPFLDIEPLPDFTQWGPVSVEPLRSIRRKVAHKMVTSMILAPHVAHMDDADVTLLEEFRQKENKRREAAGGEHFTLLAFVVKAVTAGLKEAPAFNASLDPFREVIIYKSYYNIGIAVDTGRGLLVPVIRDTDRKSILQISKDIDRFASLAREGKIEVADLRGGTFTITNVGPLGGTALIPAINYPEVAILGMGKVQDKPVVRDGKIVIRKILPLTLAFDHRIADGADAARFVSEMARQLSDPNLLLLEA
jgi:pyruvate dehydrogenase E2 component (dihydrolipoamide acetyltransferase)